jgi:hypothetical protein
MRLKPHSRDINVALISRSWSLVLHFAYQSSVTNCFIKGLSAIFPAGKSHELKQNHFATEVLYAPQRCCVRGERNQPPLRGAQHYQEESSSILQDANSISRKIYLKKLFRLLWDFFTCPPSISSSVLYPITSRSFPTVGIIWLLM